MYSQENGKCHVQFEPSGGFVTDAVSLLHSETGKREFVVETGNSGFILCKRLVNVKPKVNIIVN